MNLFDTSLFVDDPKRGPYDLDDMELHSDEADAYEEEPWDFDTPEGLIFTTLPDCGSRHAAYRSWEGWTVEEACPTYNVHGSASYENEYGGFLDYTVMAGLSCPNRSGVWITEMTMDFTEDSFTGEADADFYFGIDDPLTGETLEYRPATYPEIREHFGYSRHLSLGLAIWSRLPQWVVNLLPHKWR